MTTENNLEAIRLSKHMAHLGLCSRREADVYIEKGWVRVNGQIAVLGQKVTTKDEIKIDSQANLAQQKKLTILLNKPVAYVSAQAEDKHKSAIDLITPENYWSENNQKTSRVNRQGLAPAGRLDIDSTGLLILTQDGRIAKTIIGENSSIEKEYLVRVSGDMIPDGLKLLNHGLSLDGEALLPAKVMWQNKDQLKFILKQGKKRQIRRMCELVGLQVTALKRVRIGQVKLGYLPLGKWRYLNKSEEF